MATTKNALVQIHELVSTFVTRQKGTWGHEEWEDLLAKLAKLGFEVNDEMKRRVGNLLEESKALFFIMPTAVAPKKKTTAKQPAAKTVAKKPAAKKKA